jgi:hypothetical protein
MHMAWVRTVCGRLESRYRYSAQIVYNNFPWPEDADEARRAGVRVAAEAVLAARAGFPDRSLAALYDPEAMPKALASAHEQLDHAVDLCFAAGSFVGDRDRAEHLFARHAIEAGFR